MTDEARPHRFLTIEQAAEELSVKASLIRGLIKTGELRAMQVGSRGMWRVGRQDLEDYIVNAYHRVAERIAAGDLEDEGESDNASLCQETPPL